jgi:hypothetical protein
MSRYHRLFRPCVHLGAQYLLGCGSILTLDIRRRSCYNGQIMSLWRDEKYLRLLASSLPRFTAKGNHTFNFRCPLCGDSQTNKAKARGYVFPKGDILLYKCHNCSVALPFAALLRSQDRRLYDEYVMERLKEDGRRPVEASQTPVSKPLMAPVVSFLDRLAPVYPLSTVAHPEAPLYPVYLYAKDVRKLPDTAFDRLFATMDAHKWLLPLVGDEKAAKVSDGIAYLVQPLRLSNGVWYGAQLRMLERKEYLTFRWSHEPLKMFGLDAWTPKKLTWVVEGPIDALFVPNAISPCGSDLLSGVRVLEDADIMKITDRRVYVWDNEPKNKEITRHLRTAARLRENIVIWPRNYPKDINDMVRAGIDVNAVMPRRIFQGLMAELELAAWLKA